MKEKVLSIIVPSFNMEKYLPSCLDSVMGVDASLLDSFEVIVVNDGSTDRTSAIAHEYAKRRPDLFRVIDKANGHYGSCVNAALRVATGLFVKMLDADDSYDVKGFEDFLRRLRRGVSSGLLDAVDCVLTDYVEVDEQGHVTAKKRQIGLKAEQPFKQAVLAPDVVFQMHASAYRLSKLRGMGYVQTEGIMYTDTEWMIYPMSAVDEIIYWPISVYRYLVGREGQSVDPKVFARCAGQRVKMYMRMMKMSRDKDCSERTRQRLYRCCMRGMKTMYLDVVKKWPLSRIDAQVAVIDDAVREYGSECYHLFNDIRLTRHFNGAYFVRDWRCRRHLPFWYITLLRMYGILVKWPYRMKVFLCSAGKDRTK